MTKNVLKKQFREVFKHWRGMRNYTDACQDDYGDPGPEDCAFCKAYWETTRFDDCAGCPIRKYIGRRYCSRTPYAAATNALYNWRNDPDNINKRDLWRKAADKQIAFLKKVYVATFK